ncbi:MAG: hypothetical protein ABR576_06170 [Thermoanaerobaculia bacterium]
MIRPTVYRMILAGLFCALLPAAARAGGRNVNVSTEGRSPESCSDVRVTFDDREGLRAEEDIALDRIGGDPLRLRLPDNSGLWVHGGAGGGYALKACKAALSAEDLQRITVSHSGGKVSVDGPAGGNWAVHLILRVPRDAALDLEASNGPIGVRDMAGSVTARNENGPLSFKRCSGTIDAETRNGPISLLETTGEVSATAVNGPISITGEAGRARLVAQNGPISVRLQGDRWDGDLEARVQNGPLSLRLPEKYQSGVRVDIFGRGPVSCPEEACGQARKTWDDERTRRIEFGDSDANVRLSVANGPVTVHSGEKNRVR